MCLACSSCFSSFLCSTRLHLIEHKYSKSIILWNTTIHFFIIIIPAMAKLNCQHHYSSLQCHMILQKSFKYADLVPKKHIFLLISKIFWCKTYFSRFFKFKRTVFIFFDLKNVFTVTFDQLNASLLNTNINLWEKKSYWMKTTVVLICSVRPNWNRLGGHIVNYSNVV